MIKLKRLLVATMLILLIIPSVSMARDGITQEIHRIAIKHNIDPIFAEAVARLESGHYKSRLARNRNNLFGIKRRGRYTSFKSKTECIEYWCKLMNKPMYKGKTIDQIAPIYCNRRWAGKVRGVMRWIKRRR